jgi:PST family polysaccharide transporter
MLRDAGNMFLFRSAHNIYVLGNAFVLGLFAPTATVGVYAGAEKINSAAVGLLSPLTTALYPRAAGMAQTSMPRAARLTRTSLYVVGLVSLALGALLWLAAPLIVRVILGHGYSQSAPILRILSWRAPLVAWTNVLGFQWLLALGFERSFQRITLVALVLNILLAFLCAPRFGAAGMAWAVVTSQAVAAVGIQITLQRRRVHPFAVKSDASYA